MVACVTGFITTVMAALHGSPFLLLLSPVCGVGIALAIMHSRKDRRDHVFDTHIYVSKNVLSYAISKAVKVC